MFDFKYIMHHWKRMCDWCDEKFGQNCCDHCPARHYNCGGIFEMEPDTDFEGLAVKVDAWAKEFPEPAYPTWRDALLQCGLLYKKIDNKGGAEIVPNWPEMAKHIPADVAQPLGIMPKEAVEGVL